MTRRYVLHPGYITSVNDGDRHFIGAAQLAALYRVSQRGCTVYPNEGDTQEAIHLHPRYDGDYSLPDRWQHKVKDDE